MEKNASAFPVAEPAASDGMTLRDYFAAKAMQALLPYEKRDPEWEKAYSHLAFCSYTVADAMLAERLKGESK